MSAMFDWCAVIRSFCKIMLRPKTDVVSDININQQSVFSLIISLVKSSLCLRGAFYCVRDFDNEKIERKMHEFLRNLLRL